jgi:hypothetical protein
MPSYATSISFGFFDNLEEALSHELKAITKGG